jgi:hypothetical protein
VKSGNLPALTVRQGANSCGVLPRDEGLRRLVSPISHDIGFFMAGQENLPTRLLNSKKGLCKKWQIISLLPNR